MIRAVVKWSYIKGARGLPRAKAHINYIQYREGEDRERGPRTFFNADSASITGALIKARLDELEQRGVQIHKIMLSPGLNGVEMIEYAREMMDKLSRSKGLDLDWYAVKHGNTNHLHSHLVVMGTDLNGRDVHLVGQDSKQLRKWGNEYLEREHRIERYLDGELKRLLQEPTRAPNLEYKKTRGDEDFERLMYGEKNSNRQNAAAEQTDREWKTFDEDLHRVFAPDQSSGRRITYKQYQTESAGRLLDFHARFQEREMNTYWKNIVDNYPDLANDAERELEWLNALAQNETQNKSEPDFDKLLTGLEPVERDLHIGVKQDFALLQKESVVVPKDDRLDDTQQLALENVREMFLSAYDGKQWDWALEPTSLRDQQHLTNPIDAVRSLESGAYSDIIRSNEDDRNRADELHNRNERSR